MKTLRWSHCVFKILSHIYTIGTEGSIFYSQVCSPAAMSALVNRKLMSNSDVHENACLSQLHLALQLQLPCALYFFAARRCHLVYKCFRISGDKIRLCFLCWDNRCSKVLIILGTVSLTWDILNTLKNFPFYFAPMDSIPPPPILYVCLAQGKIIMSTLVSSTSCFQFLVKFGH